MGEVIDPWRVQQARSQLAASRTHEERLRALHQLVLLVPDDARAQYDLAREWARTGDHDAEALKHYRQAAALDGRMAEAKLGMGVIHQRRGEPDLAESLYLAAVALNPRLVKAHLNLAVIAEARGEHAHAIEVLDRAIRLSPRNPDARHGRAQALWALGRKSEALAEWDRALELAHDHAGALRGVAEALSEDRDARAGSYYDRALAADPDSSGLRVSMANWLAASGETTRAETVLRDGIAVSPTSGRLWDALTDLLRQQDRAGEAVAALRECLLREPDIGLRRRLARLLCELGRYDEAARELRPVLLSRPGDAELRRLMAAIHGCAGRHDEAVAAAHQALQLSPATSWPRLVLMVFPSRPDRAAGELVLSQALVQPAARAYGFSMLGILQLALGNASEAARLLGQAVQTAADAALPRVGRGLVYMAEKRLESAYAELRTAAILEPGDYHVQHLAGEAAFHTGRYEEAARAFDAALQVGDGEPFLRAYTFFCRARAHRKLGRTQEAVQCYLEAERLDPNYVPSYYACGVALQELGRVNDALQQYQWCVERARDHAQAWTGVATCLERLGRVPEAVEAYRAAIRARSTYAPPRYNLAVLLERVGTPEEVAALLRGYLRLAPDAPNADDAKQRLRRAELRAAGLAARGESEPEQEEGPLPDSPEEGELLSPVEA
jgi:tetratricopeptide (TPR) repeat protein